MFNDLFKINLMNSEICRKNLNDLDSVENQILMSQQFIMLMQLPEPERNRTSDWLNKCIVLNTMSGKWEADCHRANSREFH